ncbi:MAG: hypothetical protein V3U92_16695 [Cellulophaga sp.]
MNKSERILFLIKFGKKKYLERLRDKGELFFNSPEKFNKIKKSNNEQGDENEGAIWIENLKDVKLTLNHQEFGEIKFKSLPNKFVKLTQFNHNYLTCSFYTVTDKDFGQSNLFEVDEKMAEFGDHALIITNPTELIDSVFEYANREKIYLTAKKVDYEDLSLKGRIETNPFIKKEEHSYQREYRMVLNNSVESSKILLSSSLGTDGVIVPTIKNEKLKFKIN